uniref:tRNA-t(6)A37 methylthiotransferase n=1 Tax=Eptatretus burgeri TaxID=7764 RepID=A0A8C4NF63_EPTBU
MSSACEMELNDIEDVVENGDSLSPSQVPEQRCVVAKVRRRKGFGAREDVCADRHALARNKKVVVAGCVPQAQPQLGYIKGLSVIGVQQIDRVVEVVEETLKGHMVRLLGKKKVNGQRVGGARLDLPKIRRNPLIEIISINTGCLNACTYCKTKHARGQLASYPPDQLIERMQQSFQEGVCEVWLTSEDTGAYGRDIGTDLPSLLWQLVDTVPDGAMLRLGMTNPPYILEHLEEIARILSHPHVYSFLHIPVQSGSDEVLVEMKREYCIDDFCHIVSFLTERVPGLTIATDIICGFPGETKDNFEATMNLVRRYRFPSLFINQFYPRPGTPAARMLQVPALEKKQRTRELSKLFQSYQPYDDKIGQRQRVLVTEESFDGKFFVAHNKFYEQVLVPHQTELMGKMVDVDIYEVGKHYMKGRPVLNGVFCPVSIAPPLAQGKVSGLLVPSSDTTCCSRDCCDDQKCGKANCVTFVQTSGWRSRAANGAGHMLQAVGLVVGLFALAAATLVEVYRLASWLAPYAR